MKITDWKYYSFVIVVLLFIIAYVICDYFHLDRVIS